MKLERESEAEDHIAEHFSGALEEDQSSQIGALNELRNQLALARLFKWQALENVEVTHERKQRLNVGHFSKPK